MCPAEVESMAYFGEVPWHGLGTKLEKPATAAEAITAGGLDWEVETVPVSADGKEIPNYKAIRRVTDNKVFAIARDRYQPIQNAESFEFFDAVTGTGEAKYHTVGSLRGGAIIWLMAKLNHHKLVVRGDEIEKYVVLTNSHDGSRALQMFWSPVRVVCMNTLQMAESQAGQRFYARHTSGFVGKIDAAREVLGLADQHFKEWKEQAVLLAEKQLAPGQMPLLLQEAFGYKEGLDMEKVYKPTREAVELVEQLFVAGKGQKDNAKIAGTKWAAFNAVAEYTDYFKQPRGRKDAFKAANNRLNSVWFGTGAAIKERAWNYLVKN